jgi:hypothetical protein
MTPELDPTPRPVIMDECLQPRLRHAAHAGEGLAVSHSFR